MEKNCDPREYSIAVVLGFLSAQPLRSLRLGGDFAASLTTETQRAQRLRREEIRIRSLAGSFCFEAKFNKIRLDNE